MRNSHSNIQKVAVILLALLFVVVVNKKAPAAESLSSIARKFYYGQGVPKNPHKAFRLYRRAARKGDVDAMFIVGGMYMQGQGTSVDQSEAFKWLYRAALNGRSSKESERILGQFFILGKNVPQDYSEAVHWYELAAKSGDPEAQSELAYLYFTGKRVERDYGKAGHWFEVAARKGYPLAQYNMGILWYTGNGVATVDMVQAYAWFNLAAGNGHNSGEVARRFLETTLSAEELRRAQKQSTELYKEIQKMQNITISQ